MSDLNNIKILIAQSNNQKAIHELFSILRMNGKDIDAWLLLGEIIDDPAKKRDCYNQVLKLSPNNPIAMKGLGKLTQLDTGVHEIPTTMLNNSQPSHTNTEKSVETFQDLRENFQYEQRSKSNSKSYNYSKYDWKTMGFVTLGIVVFFGISYILGLILTSGDSSGDSNPLCVGMVLLCLIAGVYTWYLSRNDRSKVANSAIQEQKQIQTSKPNTYSSNPQNTTISCRICQHTVSRTAPSCPNCGEVYPGLVSKCQYCGSKNIHIRPKGFNLGKAAAGAVVAGPVGAAGGLHGRKDLEIRCSDCHRTLIIKNYEI